MKRLYNEYEAMNDEAYDLFDDVCRYVRETSDQSRFADISLRDIEQVIHSAVSGTIAEIVLRRARDKRKAEKSK